MKYKTKQPEYSRWKGMMNRCYRVKNKDYKWYGAKNVTVCDEWLNNYYAFEAWMFSQPAYGQDNMVVSRFADAGNYSPDNCRLITRAENLSQVKKGKRVMCAETGEVFDTAKEAAIYLGLNINAVIQAANPKDKTKSAGSYHWQYI